MARTESRMLPLGTLAPDFALPDPAGRVWRLNDFAPTRALLVAFICNHCPYVVHVIDAFVALSRQYLADGVRVVAISANDVARYPQDAPDKMAEFARAHGFEFPYLYDESQAVARAYEAACTPDFYVFGADMRLVYRGRMDGATPGNAVAVTGAELRAALDAVLDGRLPEPEQTASMGCNIKWKA